MKKTTVTVVAGMFLASTLLGCNKNDGSEAAPITSQDSTRRYSYNNGVYTATGEYGNLPSHIIVTVTLLSDTITAVTVVPQATDPTSLDLQRRFAAAVPGVVVGKNIDEVNVGRLAGSTGTPMGFNDAIAQIKKRAIKNTQ